MLSTVDLLKTFQRTNQLVGSTAHPGQGPHSFAVSQEQQLLQALTLSCIDTSFYIVAFSQAVGPYHFETIS